MKTILGLLALSFSAAAPAATVCYQIYSSSNTLVWQGSQPPVRLDRPAIEDEVKKMVPGGHLIIVDDHGSLCQPIDTRPGKTSRQVGGRYGNGNGN
ncbi:MAG: hypothetical protein LBD06_07825 [Candidatus Accumulibacter sp.]|jgi:hypothetical protein|nr:hypothetical protein [Accumulibacter sp.]